MPPAFVDFEDENHTLIHGAWREPPSVAVSREQNATTLAKEQRDQLKAYFLSPAGSCSLAGKYDLAKSCKD